jgi:hypothetical protein
MLISKLKKIILKYLQLKNTFKILYNIKHLFTSPKKNQKRKRKKKRVTKLTKYCPPPHERSFIPKSHIARLEVEMLALKSLNLAISLCTPPNISTLNVL